MDYFKDAIVYFRANPKRSVLIMMIDFVFIFLFMPIATLSANIFMNQITRVSVVAAGTMMQSGEGLINLKNSLLRVILGMAGSVALFFFLVILNIAVFKIIIWLLTLHKKVTYQMILKGLAVTLIMELIFIIPWILAFIPFFRASSAYMRTRVLDIGFIELLPIILVFFIYVYFISLAFYFLAKDGRIWSALRNGFLKGITDARMLPAFLGLFLIAGALFKLLRDAGALIGWGFFVFIFVVVMISFFNRIHIHKCV